MGLHLHFLPCVPECIGPPLDTMFISSEETSFWSYTHKHCYFIVLQKEFRWSLDISALYANR